MSLHYRLSARARKKRRRRGQKLAAPSYALVRRESCETPEPILLRPRQADKPLAPRPLVAPGTRPFAVDRVCENRIASPTRIENRVVGSDRDNAIRESLARATGTASQSRRAAGRRRTKRRASHGRKHLGRSCARHCDAQDERRNRAEKKLLHRLFLSAHAATVRLSYTHYITKAEFVQITLPARERVHSRLKQRV